LENGIVPEGTLLILVTTAAGIGFLHTLTGPDHYVPFVAMARIGRWSLARTVAITLACGMGHVLGSVLLGGLGIALGLAVGKLAWFEQVRGELAGWLLLGFGLAYLAWGIKRAIRNQPHSHVHAHPDGSVHAHRHTHADAHMHVHADEARAASMTPWILFAIFVFGPCEPLIPLLMFPAAKLSIWGIALVTLVFGASTLATMTGLVAAGHLGLGRVSFSRLGRFSHALAGLAIAACGAAIQFGL
jgi:sulfite exporter TauE/SafE